MLAVLGSAGFAASPAAAQEAPTVGAAAVAATSTVGIVLNTPPRAGADGMTTQQDHPVTLDLLANDHDPDGDPLGLLGATSAAHGTLTFTGGVVTYSPDPGFSGADAFTYLLTDGRGGDDTGHVQVTVVAPIVVGPHPHPPHAPHVPGPVEVSPLQPTAPQAPAPQAPVPPALPMPLVEVVAGSPTAPVLRSVPGVRAPAGHLPERSTAVRTGPVVPATPQALPFTGDRTALLTPLGAGLAGAGALLCLLGRRRPRC